MLDKLEPTLPASSLPPRRPLLGSKSRDVVETEDALLNLHREINLSDRTTRPWEKARSVDRFGDQGQNSSQTKGLFSTAQTGSVNMVKSKFEKKSVTPVSTPLLGPRQKSATPFRTARSPSPTTQPISTLRRRSPSPVKTGNVNRVRSRFESGGSSTSSQNGSSTTTNQTLPKTFKSGVLPDLSTQGKSVSTTSLMTSWKPLGDIPESKRSVPSRFLKQESMPKMCPQTPPSLRARQVDQELIHDAASFLSQKLPSIAPGGIIRGPSSPLNHQISSKVIRGPFGYSDL